MNEPFLNIKNMLSEEEIQKLKFTETDREAVYEKIQNSNGLKKNKVFRLHTLVLKALMPVTVIIILFTLLLQTPIKKQVLAAIPLLESLFSNYGDEGQKKAVQEIKLQNINQSSEDNGVKITFNEILYDGARISVAYTIEATQGNHKGENLDILLFNLKVNGQDINTDHGFSGGHNDKKIGNKFLKINNVDVGQELPDEFTLNLVIQELILLDTETNQTIKGNWSFSLPVKRVGETYVYTPSVSKQADSGEIRIKRIVFAPSGTQIEIETKLPMALVPEIPTMSRMSFQVFDPNNKEIKIIDKSLNSRLRYKNGIQTRTYSLLLQPMKKIPEFITIRSNEMTFEVEDSIKNISENLPIYLPQGKIGGIVIKKIEKKQGELWVHFDMTGKDYILERKNQFQLINGDEIRRENFIPKIGDGDNMNNDESRNQIVKFKTSYNENLYFYSPGFAVPKVLNEWELEIPIQKKELIKVDK